MSDTNQAAIVISTVRQHLEKKPVMDQLVRMVRDAGKVERYIVLALNMIKGSSQLALSEPRSIVGSILEGMQLNLAFDKNLGQAYLVPFNNAKSGTKICTMIAGYRGFCQLAYNSALISSIDAEVVRAGDEFDISLGSKRFLHHVPNFEKPGRHLEENWIGAYATVTFTDGRTSFEFMTADEVNAIRKRSRAKDKGPWVSDTDKMWRKTPIRLLCKRLPQSPENLTIVHAATVDEMRDLGLAHGRHVPNVGEPTPEPFEEFMTNENLEADAAAQEPKPEVERKSERKAKKSAPVNDGTTGVPKAEIPKDPAPAKPGFGPSDRIDQPRIHAIAETMKRKKMTEEEIVGFLGSFSYVQVSDITQGKFNDVWASLTVWKRGNVTGAK
jgi:recombination protein RecT